MKICKECNGKGYDFDASDFSNKRCLTCDGTGKIDEPVIKKKDNIK